MKEDVSIDTFTHSQMKAIISYYKNVRAVTSRYRRIDKIPYNFRIVKIYLYDKNESLEKEQKLLSQFSEYLYIPKKSFGGYSECVSNGKDIYSQLETERNIQNQYVGILFSVSKLTM